MSDIDSRVLECGKTIDELCEYLASDRIPRDPTIETCPECLRALDALDHVSRLSRNLAAQDAADLPVLPESWLTDLLATIGEEVRSGRTLPLHSTDPRVDLRVTEGAVRALIRSVGDEIDGLIIGRCDLVGEAEAEGAPVQVNLTASVVWGKSAPALSAALRASVSDALRAHTDLNVVEINIAITDLHVYTAESEAAS